MSRPESVRCENCCWWQKPTETWGREKDGVCRFFNRDYRLTAPDYWCREFREEWPSVEDRCS